jgi:hypothetical protein
VTREADNPKGDDLSRIRRNAKRLLRDAVLLTQHERQIASARSDSGTENTSRVFIRSGGMVQIALSRSISRHVAPSVSPVRVAVRIRNTSASAAMPSDDRRRFTKAGTSA